MSDEKEIIDYGQYAAGANAESNEVQQLTAEQLSSELEDSESDDTVHQSIDEYNHI